MNTAILGLALLATAADASQSSPTYASLTKSLQISVQDKLTQWKAEFGALAQAQGLVPQSQKSIQVNGHSLDELERFHSTITQVQEASRRNPHARFSEFNIFALVTLDEFKQHLQASFAGSKLRESQPAAEDVSVMAATDVDWTNSTCNSPVRNQGGCGSCWAFSTITAVESAHCLVTGELLDLAEQQLVSCGTGNYGCNGGFTYRALDYMQREGVCLEEAYPYESGTTKENGACSTTCKKQKLAFGKYVHSSGEAALLKALVKQPVTILVEAGNAVWKNYVGGVVTECPGASSDHAVVAVASGTSTDDYIKIKNSWGTKWGESGYIYIKRGGAGKGICNIVQQVVYPSIVIPTTPTTTSSVTTKPVTITPQPSTATPTTVSPTTAAPTTIAVTPAPTVPLTPIPTTDAPTPLPTSAAPTTAAPTTASPSTPSPTTTSPANICGTCKTCYFPTNKWCVGSVSKEGCLISTGSVWCGA